MARFPVPPALCGDGRRKIFIMKSDNSAPSLRHPPASLDRRTFLRQSVLAAGAMAAGGAALSVAPARAQRPPPDAAGAASERKAPTRFLHACMTLPYRNFPLDRALKGIKGAGYDHVAWGTQHRESNGENRLVLAPDAAPARAADLARRCRDQGLEPVKMFAAVYPDLPEAIPALTARIKQASAAKIRHLLVFGQTKGGDPKLWVERFKALGPIAKDADVTLVMKQHGGATTGTGQALAKIVSDVAHANVLMSYDAGNVLWYQNVDPIADIATCADMVRAFCIKDCRNWPRKATCGPGYGEIDHYRLFAPVAFTGLTMPLAYENITPSYVTAPADNPETIDRWARLAREYLENVIRGLHAV